MFHTVRFQYYSFNHHTHQWYFYHSSHYQSDAFQYVFSCSDNFDLCLGTAGTHLFTGCCQVAIYRICYDGRLDILTPPKLLFCFVFSFPCVLGCPWLLFNVHLYFALINQFGDLYIIPFSRLSTL